MTMLRYNAGKPPLTLVPTAFIRAIAMGWEGDYFTTPNLLVEDVARVLYFGSKKYTANNWRKGGSWTSVLDCGFRHMNKIARGETHDDESGLHHYAHVGCNIAFLMEFIEQKSGFDDRYKLSVPSAPKHGYAESEFNSIYNDMLLWKDGDSFGLNGAAVTLAKAYEELNPRIQPGSSPHACVQIPTPPPAPYIGDPVSFVSPNILVGKIEL